MCLEVWKRLLDMKGFRCSCFTAFLHFIPTPTSLYLPPSLSSFSLTSSLSSQLSSLFLLLIVVMMITVVCDDDDCNEI